MNSFDLSFNHEFDLSLTQDGGLSGPAEGVTAVANMGTGIAPADRGSIPSYPRQKKMRKNAKKRLKKRQ